jgi:hypothetical protein
MGPHCGPPGNLPQCNRVGYAKTHWPRRGTGPSFCQKVAGLYTKPLKSAFENSLPARRAVPHGTRSLPRHACSAHRVNARAGAERCSTQLELPECSGHDAIGCYGSLACRLKPPATRPTCSHRQRARKLALSPTFRPLPRDTGNASGLDRWRISSLFPARSPRDSPGLSLPP